MFRPQTIVVDMDRTLLRDDKSISPYTYEVIKQCHDLGIQIIIATARARRLTIDFLESLHCNIYICNNGSQIFVGNELIYSQQIEYNTAIILWNTVQEMYPEATLSIESNDMLYADNPIVITPAIVDKPEHIPSFDVDRITIGGIDLSNIDAISDMIPKNLYAQNITNRFIMIMHKNASKGHALKYISQQKNISLEKMICFGDDMNDVSMFEVCGCSVAVNNGINQLQNIADYVTLSNEEDGVARFISKLI